MSMSEEQDPFREGIAQFKSGNFQQAVASFLNIIDKDNTNHKAWNALGVVYTTMGRYGEANTCYEKALQLSPNTKPYLRNLERNRANIDLSDEISEQEDPHAAEELWKKAQVLRDLGSLEESVDAYDLAIKSSPKNAHLWLEKGQVLYELQKFEDAVKAFDQVIRYDPENFLVYESKAHILRFNLNRIQEAIDTYEKGIELISSGNSALYLKGLSYEGLTKPEFRDESLRFFEQAIINIRLCYSMLQNKGDGLFSIGQFDKAVDAFDQAIRLSAEFAWANYSQGAIISLLLKPEEGPDAAIKVFNNAHDNFHDLEKIYYMKGLALGKTGKFEEAITAINQGIRVDPKYTDALKKEE